VGRLTCLKPRVGAAPVSRLAEAGPEATAAHEREHTGRPWRRIRARVLKRDCGMCVPCRQAERFTLAVDVDHVRPVWEGGTDDDGNLQSICSDCHKEKSAREAARRAAT